MRNCSGSAVITRSSTKSNCWRRNWRRFDQMPYQIVNRREWILRSSGALALAALNRSIDAQEYRIGGADIKLGIASYSFRKFSREQAIQMTKEIGTPYLNVK